MVNTKAIAGFVAGLSVGAIAAILLSPAKGADTRRKIIDKTGELCNSVKDSVTGFVKGKEKKKNYADNYSQPIVGSHTMG